MTDTLPQIRNLLTWLDEHAPLSALMPCQKGTKFPLVPHSKDKVDAGEVPHWDNKQCRNYLRQAINGDITLTDSWAILLHDLVVIDCDSEEVYQFFKEKFPTDFVDAVGPCQKTSKGYHFLFARPERFNELNITDLAPGFIIDGKRFEKCDLKTITGTGTRGVLSVTPTKGKEWIVAPWETVLAPPSEELEEWIITHYGKKKKPTRQVSTPTPSEASTEASETAPAIETTLLTDLLTALAPARADNYRDWFTVACIVKEHGDYNTFNNWSKTSPMYDEAAGQKLWKSLRDKSAYSLATLWWMVRKDNLEKFNELKERYGSGSTLYSLVTNNHRDLAQLFCHQPEATRVLYDDATGWAYCPPSTNRWICSGKNEPALLRNSIARVLLPICHEAAMYWVNKSTSDPDCAQITQGKTKEINKAQVSLCGAPFIKGVTQFIQSIRAEATLDIVQQAALTNSRVTSLADLLDSNPYVIAFTDKKYDHITKTWSPVVPTDYISRCTGYPAPDKNEADVADVRMVLHGIWCTSPTEKCDGHCGANDMVDYICKVFAMSLCGKKWAEAFFMHTGTGGNGKGLLFDAVKAVLGDYLYEFNAITMADEGKPNQASAEAANFKGRFLAMATEPDGEKDLSEAIIKKWTGGDALNARLLYGNPTVFQMFANLHLQCNKRPEIANMTKGGVRRLRVIPYYNQFSTHPKDGERKGDAQLKDFVKTPRFRDAFFWILLESFASIEGLAIDAIPMPAPVKKATEEYIEENNAFWTWFKDTFERTTEQVVNGEECFLFEQDIAKEYAMYSKSKFTTKHCEERMKFNGVLSEKKTWGKVGKGRKGYGGWIRKPEPTAPISEDE